MVGEAVKYPNGRLISHAEVVRIPVEGKRVVVPTNSELGQIGRNEWQLSVGNGGTPWGGAKQFSAPPDNLPGTLRLIEGDNCYLMPVDQSVKSKVLHSGYLSEKGALTVDTELHTLTEEFTIVNEGAGSDVTVIDDCSSAVGWNVSFGTGSTLESVDSEFHVSAFAEGSAVLIRTFNNLTGLKTSDFCIIRGRVPDGQPFPHMFFRLVDTGGRVKIWHGSTRFDFGSTLTTFVLPVNAPCGTEGSSPTDCYDEFDINELSYIEVGIDATTGEFAEFYISSITACNGTWATVEVMVPDELQIGPVDEKYLVECNTYDVESSTYKPSLFHNIPNDTFLFRADGMYTMDGTCVRDILSVSNYVQVAAAYSIAESSSVALRETTSSPSATPASITYSSAHGAEKRIGFAILVPPSDNGRTDINKVQLELVTHCDDQLGNRVPDRSGNHNDGTIVGGVRKLNEGGLEFDGNANAYIDLKKVDIDRIFPLKAKLIPFDTTTRKIFATFSNNYFELNASGKIYAYINASETGAVVSSNYIYTENDILDLEFTWDGDNLSLFVNGVFDKSVQLKGIIENISSEYNRIIGAYRPDEFNFNGIIKSIEIGNYLKFIPSIKNMGAATIELSDDDDLATGLLNMSKPVIALYDPDKNDADVFVFTERPSSVKYVQDENGDVSELIIDPGNGSVYHERQTFTGMSSDDDGNAIPDFLEKGRLGSVLNTHAPDEFNRGLFDVYTHDVSVIENNFGKTLENIDDKLFAVRGGEVVLDENMNVLTKVESVDTATGPVDFYDAEAHPTMQVLGTPGKTSGDVPVWDTVTAGNTDESTWVRVTDVDHVFSGDCWIENGILKFKNFQAYDYDGNSLNLFMYSPPSSLTIVDIGNDVVTFILSIDGIEYAGKVIRGCNSVIFEDWYNLSYTLMADVHIAISSSGNLVDSRLYTGPAAWKLFAPDAYYTLINLDDLTKIRYQVSKSLDSWRGYYNGVSGFSTFGVYQSESWAFGALPISPIYIEAEADSGGHYVRNGITYYTGSDAYPFAGNTGNALDVIYRYAGVLFDGLPAGKYTAFYRAKAVGDPVLCHTSIYSKVNGTSTGIKTLDSDIIFENDFSTYSIEFDYDPSGHNFLYLHRDSDAIEGNYIVVDYILVVMTEKIQQPAERSLIKTNTTKAVKLLPR